MIKVIALVLSAIIAIVAIGSFGFIAVKTVMYIVNQHFGFGDAISWAWQDYCDFVSGIFGGGAKAEDNYWEVDYTVNKYIPVVACTSL